MKFPDLSGLRPLFIVFLIVFGSCKVTDDESPDPDEVFVKYIGVSGIQRAVDFVYNESRQEYMILAYQDKLESVGESSTNGDFYFVTTTKEGNEFNSFQLDLNLGEDVPKRIKQLDDDRYLFIGSSTLDGETSLVWGIISHDLDSNSVSSFGIELKIGSVFMEGADIIPLQSDPGSVVILGTTDTREEGDLASDAHAKQFFIGKYNLDTGAEIWRKSHGNDGDDLARAIFETSSGGFLLFGSTSAPGVSMDGSPNVALGLNAYILGTNALGGLDAAEGTYGTLRGINNFINDEVNDVVPIDNGYAILGTSKLTNGTNPYPFLLFSSTSGDLLPSVVYRSDTLGNKYDLTSNGYAITQTLDGGFIIMGSYTFFIEDQSEQDKSRLEEVMVLKTDNIGIRKRVYDEFYGLVNGNDRANAVKVLPDGKVAALCTFDFGNNNTLIGLMKLNANGQLKQ